MLHRLSSGGNALMKALALSCLVHAAPFTALLHNFMEESPLSAGETIMEVDLIIAEAEQIASPILEAITPPIDDTITQPPAIEAAQVAEKNPEIPEEPEKPEERAERSFVPAPPDLAVQKAETTLFSAATPPSAALPASREVLAATSDAYRARVARHLAKFKRFPAELPQAITGGRVIIRFALDGTGRVVDAQVIETSRVPALDAEAIAMLRRAEPFPTFQPASQSQYGIQVQHSFTMPVNYRLKE